MASYLTAGLSVKCITCRSCAIRSIQQVEYLPLASIVNASVQHLCNFMENYSPLCAFVHIFESFRFGNCNISVTLVEHFSQGFGFLQRGNIWKNLQIFEGGRGDSEYGLLVVFRIMHCRVMLFGFTIPNHVSTSRVLLSGTHYALITRTTIVSIMYCY